MKRIIKIVAVLVVAGMLGGYIYWQANKHKIIRDSIEKAIAKKTDSLYYLHYDSSRIDELNGNASFYNVSLQSDSAQKALLNSTDSLPANLFNIRVREIRITGADIPGLLQKQNLAAKQIELIVPVMQVIHTGAEPGEKFTAQDTLELYKKLLGRFKRIEAGRIEVVNGTVLFTNKEGKVQTALENISVGLNHFMVDSTKDYHNIISYFIKDVRVTVDNIQLPATNNGTRMNLEKLEYNAPQRYLSINSITQYPIDKLKAVTELKNTRVNGLNTDAFILQQRLKAGQISCEGGLITIYVKNKAAGKKLGDKSIELSTDIIDQAQVDGITLGSTKFIIVNQEKPKEPPFVLENARFKLTKMLRVGEGMTVSNVINNADWELSADGFFVKTKDNLYTMRFGDFTINSAASRISISSFTLKPGNPRKQQSPYQHDVYDLSFNKIELTGVNIKKLIGYNELEVDLVSLQPAIRIFNDRTLPPESKSKVGNYPHQQILKLPLPVYIGKIRVDNALVSYRERAAKSAMTGDVYFSNVNATITNLTNVGERIKAQPILKLNAKARFLGAGILSTEWRFPLTTTNGAFTITGHLDGMDAPSLNSIIEPLAMASAKQGEIDGLNFTIDGTDTMAIGKILMNYHDLKMDLLKKSEGEGLKKKGFLSFVANAIVKNNNYGNAPEQVNYERDQTRSFFNLVWKTIFEGAKKAAM